MQEQKNIYCISGLGADGHVFEQLQIAGHLPLVHVPYLTPLNRESLASYAGRMTSEIQEPCPILLGVSFGGMLAIEMAKQRPVRAVIVISGVKTFHELPRWMRLTGALRLHQFLPVRSNALTKKADDRRMGIKSQEQKQLVELYRKTADQRQLNWAIDKVLRWKNDWIPENLYHIHGADDRMFPLRNIVATHVIENAGHIMILDRGREISACIETILKEVGYDN